MNREFKNECEMIGLDEINRTEKSDVNGGLVATPIIIDRCLLCIPFLLPPIPLPLFPIAREIN